MGGVQHSTLNFCIGLRVHQNISVSVWVPGKGTFTEELAKNGINYNLFPRPAFRTSSISFGQDKFRLPNISGLLVNFFLILKQAANLNHLLKSACPDHFITKGMFAHISGGFASLFNSYSCTWHLQDEISERYMGAYRKFFNLMAIFLPDRIIVDGGSIIEKMSQSVKKKSLVIFNGVDVEKLYQPQLKQTIRKEFKIPDDAYVVGNIARITPWKGQKYLLEAFENYHQNNPKSYLFIVGSTLFGDDSFLDELRQFIKLKNLTDWVILTGYKLDIAALFSGMDLFVYPSVEKDTSPLSLISALAAGKPVAISDIQGLIEMTKNALTVQVFRNRNINDMVKIMKFYESLEKREEDGKKNRTFALEQFSIQSYTTKILASLNIK